MLFLTVLRDGNEEQRCGAHADEDLSLVGIAEAGQKAQKGCLSASRWSQESQELALVNVKADVVKNTLVAETLCYILEFYDLVV